MGGNGIELVRKWDCAWEEVRLNKRGSGIKYVRKKD